MAELKTVKRNVGTCPACREYLWAEVDIAAKVSEPDWPITLDKPTIYARVSIVGMRLEHTCAKEEDDSRSNRRSVDPEPTDALEGAQNGVHRPAPSAPDAVIACHCGRPVAYGYDGDPSHHRGMCQACDLARCDAYPQDCPNRATTTEGDQG